MAERGGVDPIVIDAAWTRLDAECRRLVNALREVAGQVRPYSDDDATVTK